MAMSEKRKLVFFFSGATIFALLLILGTNLLLKLIPTPPSSQSSTLSDIGTTRTSIIDLAGEDMRPILFQEDGFAPEEVIIRSSDAIGCLITVLNNTNTPLDIGVSPHRDPGHPGADTPEIAPGGKILLDPRYPGLAGVVYHSHTEPIREFTVRYGEGCQ